MAGAAAAEITAGEKHVQAEQHRPASLSLSLASTNRYDEEWNPRSGDGLPNVLVAHWVAKQITCGWFRAEFARIPRS